MKGFAARMLIILNSPREPQALRAGPLDHIPSLGNGTDTPRGQRIQRFQGLGDHMAPQHVCPEGAGPAILAKVKPPPSSQNIKQAAMPAEHVKSYYAATANPAPRYPALAGNVDCDVCVIGGGIAGCSSALHLAERGFNVVLLEDQRIGWGASGRSGAQVLPGFSSSQDKIERLVGRDNARALWDIT